MKLFLTVASLAAAMALVVGPAEGAPSQFQLIFDGHHVVADFPTPTGLAHVGPFTTNSALCPSGNAHDIAQTDQVATRLFTCDSGNGTFTATISPHLAEHGGAGTWQITAGTGSLADLRGRGSFSSVLTSGNANDVQSISFHSTWQGVVDLDVNPPTVALTTAHLRKLQARNSYLLQLRVSISDAPGNAVSYTLLLADPRDPVDDLVRVDGHVSTGSIAHTYHLHTKATTHVLRLTIIATDPVGNTSTFKSNIRLR